ncbi:MAG: relaxase/mobilization nuclease domain-containing protein [Clostridia bacterium]|nr:relaxase/mobilization nuclease domain-containing protein [Clostridia bacterium]
MAIVKNIPESKQSPSAQKGVLDYCMRPDKTTSEEQTMFVNGVNCVPEFANESFLATQNLFGHKQGARFFHYVQSFPPNEDITPELAHKIATELAEAFGNREIVVATHLDAGHLHSHLVVNSYDLDTGRKLHANKFFLSELRQKSDELCLKYGLSVLQKYDPQKRSTNLGSREYRTAQKGQSWKFKLMAAINSAMKTSGSREEFIKNMERLGYMMTWTDERKNITFLCPNGMKCRDNKLHDEKYLKENIENEFKIRERLAAQFGAGKSRSAERRRAFCDRVSGVRAAGLRDPGASEDGGIQSAEAGGVLSADAVPADRSAGDAEGTAGIRQSDIGYRSAVYGTDGRESDSGKSGNGDEPAGQRLTGWEESRDVYLGQLEAAARNRKRYQINSGEPAAAAHPDHGNDGGGFGAVVGAGVGGVLALGALTDGDEDEEERRKRMEADANGAAVGAAIGFAAGLILAAAEDSSDEDEAETTNNSPMWGEM